MAGLVRKKKLKPAERTGQAAEAVALLNPKLAAVLEVFDDIRDKPAGAGADKAGALFGVPLFLKDIGSSFKGRRQEWGSKLLKNNVAKATDPKYENFLVACLFSLGRSTTP